MHLASHISIMTIKESRSLSKLDWFWRPIRLKNGFFFVRFDISRNERNKKPVLFFVEMSYDNDDS